MKDSGLANAFQEGKRGITLVDFSWYEPSNEPGVFMAALLNDANGRLIGVAAFQVSLKQINEIMGERAGLGETGETYLVGPDMLMRSDSFLDPENHSVIASFANPNMGSVDTEAARQALAGETAEDIIIDYNGNPVLSAYTPLQVFDHTWALLEEIDEAEVNAPIRTLVMIILIIINGDRERKQDNTAGCICCRGDGSYHRGAFRDGAAASGPCSAVQG